MKKLTFPMVLLLMLMVSTFVLGGCKERVEEPSELEAPTSESDFE